VGRAQRDRARRQRCPETPSQLKRSHDPHDDPSRAHDDVEQPSWCGHVELVDGVLRRTDDGHTRDKHDNAAHDDERWVDANKEADALNRCLGYARSDQTDESRPGKLLEERGTRQCSIAASNQSTMSPVKNVARLIFQT
jgi:hypothetical protein